MGGSESTLQNPHLSGPLGVSAEAFACVRSTYLCGSIVSPTLRFARETKSQRCEPAVPGSIPDPQWGRTRPERERRSEVRGQEKTPEHEGGYLLVMMAELTIEAPSHITLRVGLSVPILP